LAGRGGSGKAVLPKVGPGAGVIAAGRQGGGGVRLNTAAMVGRLVGQGHETEHMRESLSAREREVLQLMADGVGTRRIAQQLGISYSTVRTHIRSIGHKLGVRSMVNAVVTARELELVN